jgi:hypothetical protein
MKRQSKTHSNLLSFLILLLATTSLGWSQFSNSPKPKPDKKPSKLVLGVVVDQDDQPISTAVVSLTNLQTKKISQDITDDKGEFRFGGLNPENDYDVQASFHDIAGEKERISMYDSRAKREYYWKLPVKLTDASQEVPVGFLVMNEQRRSVAGATLKFTSTKKIQTLTATTDAEGRAQKWLSRADVYSIIVEAKGFETQVQKAFTPVREIAFVEIPLKAAK